MMRTRQCWNTARSRASMACMFALLLAVAPGAASAQKFILKQAMAYPFPYGLTAATHGNRIAWVFNLHGSRNVWVADGPGFNARQLTHYTGDDGMPAADAGWRHGGLCARQRDQQPGRSGRPDRQREATRATGVGSQCGRWQ